MLHGLEAGSGVYELDENGEIVTLVTLRDQIRELLRVTSDEGWAAWGNGSFPPGYFFWW